MKSIDVQWLGRIEYGAALRLQNKLVSEYLSGAEGEKLLLLEHEPVYTIGRTRDQSSLRSPEVLPLVAYPIVDLERRGRDLHRYMRFLEEIVILTCRELGVESHRREGLTGVWVSQRKIASIGVGVRRWVTMHGLALNVVQSSLEPFRHITPCGISGIEMTCLEMESHRSPNVEDTARVLADIFLRKVADLSLEESTRSSNRSDPARRVD